MTPALSRPDDIPALRRLWSETFGDGNELLDPFFSRLYRPEDCFVIRGNRDQLLAMVHQLPMTICTNKRGWRASYLYAVATDPSERGRGLCSRLLTYAGSVMAERGCKALLLVPGEPKLWDFYRARGFDTFSSLDWFETDTFPVKGDIERVTVPEYLEIRERMLSERTYVSCPVPVLAFQERIAAQNNGGFFRLSCGETEGCTCAALDNTGRAVVYELLWPGEPQTGGGLAARAVGAKRAIVRVPGTTEPFSMIRWLTGEPKLTDPYMGIALD